jgi:hypothetical protein
MARPTSTQRTSPRARVDVYDSTFHRVKLSREDPDGYCSDYPSYCLQNAFKDENLPRPYAPFNVQAIGNDIVVTYAIHQQQVAPLEADGPGLGFVDIYSSTGQLLLRLQHGVASHRETTATAPVLDSTQNLILTLPRTSFAQVS